MSTFLDAPASSARENRPPRLIEDAPALTSADWLPERSGWPELDELGAEHRRLLGQRDGIASEYAELRREFEGQDEAARVELTAAYREGREPMAPDVTPPPERRAALDALVQKMDAANDALDGFLTDAITRIESAAVGWQSDLIERLSAATAKREEAQRLLAEAAAEELRVKRMEEFVVRNAGLHERKGFRTIPALRYVGWGMVSTFNPPPESDDDATFNVVPPPPERESWDAERKAAARALAERESLISGEPFPTVGGAA